MGRGFKIVRFGAVPVILIRAGEDDFRAFSATCTHLDCIVEYQRAERRIWCWLGPYGLDLSYPPLWGTLCLAAIAGTLVAYPFHLWMIQQGLICWVVAAEENSVRKLAWYLQAGLFLLAVAVMIAAIMLSIQLSAQNT